MTEQRIRRLKARIMDSRTRLLSDDPFFALLLMYIRFIAVPGMKKISTNGEYICFSPDFMDKLYDSEVDFILRHQIMHIICGHIWRPADMRDDDYHYACDISVNRLLEKMGAADGRYPHLGIVPTSFTGMRPDQDAAEMTPDEILGMLPFSLYSLDERSGSRYLADSDAFWDASEPPPTGVLILDIPEEEGLIRNVGKRHIRGTDGGGESDPKQLWQDRAMVAAKALNPSEDNGSGNTPDFIRRMINKLREPTVDWKKILDDFIQERTCDYSFSPPDRRFADTGFFLPDFNEKDYVARDILFMVDTSGSVDDDTLTAVYSEIRGVIEQFGDKLNGKLGFFDADITEPLPFASVSDLLRIIPYGGGGTDFRPIFDYVRNHYTDVLPACIVIFTDGRGSYPSERDTPGIPVLWLLMNSDVTPPFGRVARIIED